MKPVRHGMVLRARLERKIFSTFNQNGATDAVNGITDMLDNGFDNISIGHFNRFQ
jgi:hypothetical protein